MHLQSRCFFQTLPFNGFTFSTLKGDDSNLCPRTAGGLFSRDRPASNLVARDWHRAFTFWKDHERSLMKSKDFRPLSIRLLYLRHCEGLGTLCSSFWSFVSWEICPRHHREPLFSRQIVSDVVRKFENRGIEKQSRISFRSAEVGNPYEVYEVGNRRESAKSVESRESKTSKSIFWTPWQVAFCWAEEMKDRSVSTSTSKRRKSRRR